MKTTSDQISFIKITAYKSLVDLEGDQDAFKRFIYCSFDKIYKCFDIVEMLYEQIDANENIEYSLGIILRSVTMNCLMIQNMRYIVYGLEPNLKNSKEIQTLLDETALKFIADGSDNLIKDLEFDDKLSDETKKELADKISSKFPNVFRRDERGAPKLNREFKVVLKDLYVNSQHPNLLSLKTIYNHYTYYSKYDHLSHWSSALSNEIEFSVRKKRVESCIAMVFISVRDLLFVGLGFIPELADRWFARFSELESFAMEMVKDK